MEAIKDKIDSLISQYAILSCFFAALSAISIGFYFDSPAIFWIAMTILLFFTGTILSVARVVALAVIESSKK